MVYLSSHLQDLPVIIERHAEDSLVGETDQATSTGPVRSGFVHYVLKQDTRSYGNEHISRDPECHVSLKISPFAVWVIFMFMLVVAPW